MPEELLRLEDYLNTKKNSSEDDEYELDQVPDYLYSSPDEIKNLIRSGVRIFGEPAASLTWGIDGQRLKASLQPGIEGEKHTAKILESFVQQTPGAFVFHSLSWPESNGDTDHIVVYKDLVIIVDSKRWKAQRKYSVTDKGSVKRGTVAFPQGRVKIGYAAKAWRKKIPRDVTVKSIVCIAQEKVFVTRDKNWYKAPYRLVESSKLIEQLQFIINNHKPKTEQVSGQMLMYFAKMLVKPRDILSEIINKEGLIKTD